MSIVSNVDRGKAVIQADTGGRVEGGSSLTILFSPGAKYFPGLGRRDVEEVPYKRKALRAGWKTLRSSLSKPYNGRTSKNSSGEG